MVAFGWLWLVPALYAMAVSRRNAFKDQKEMAQGIIGYGAASIPVLGNILQTAMSTRYEYTLTPIVQLPKEAIMAARGTPAAVKAMINEIGGKRNTQEDMRKLGSAFHHWLLTAGYAAGFPAPQLWITGTGIKDLATGETKNPLRLFLSEWSLEMEKGRPKLRIPAAQSNLPTSNAGATLPRANLPQADQVRINSVLQTIRQGR